MVCIRVWVAFVIGLFLVLVACIFGLRFDCNTILRLWIAVLLIVFRGFVFVGFGTVRLFGFNVLLLFTFCFGFVVGWYLSSAIGGFYNWVILTWVILFVLLMGFRFDWNFICWYYVLVVFWVCLLNLLVLMLFMGLCLCFVGFDGGDGWLVYLVCLGFVGFDVCLDCLMLL